jgi:hypothetical protein
MEALRTGVPPTEDAGRKWDYGPNSGDGGTLIGWAGRKTTPDLALATIHDDLGLCGELGTRLQRYQPSQRYIEPL